MSEISIYDIVPTPKLADKLIGTSVGGTIPDVTYNFTLEELLQLFIPNIPANTLQGVLDYGNTATQDINLTGTINTTDLNVLATANILDSVLTGETHIEGELFDRLDSKGTAGQVLTSTGSGVEWYTIPTVIPTLQQVLQSGNTSNISIILTANITAVTATASNVVSNTSLSVNGTLKDGTSSAGGVDQILSSTGSGVKWVDMPVYNAVSPLLYNSVTKTFSIQVANSSQGGYLSSADWINFDGKQDAIILTTSGTSGAATFVGNTLNIPVYSPDLSGYVPTSRTLTINGVTYDLSANRSWTIAAGVASVTATSPLASSGGANPNITIQVANATQDGYLSSTDWNTFNSKGSGTLSSVGVSMPSAFNVANSPLTANGTIAITGAGTTAQYVRGDGTLATFPTIASEAQRLVTEVYNNSGATLTKGTVVYVNGGQGNLPTIAKAIATGDSTSAQTYGVVQNDITNMNNGYVVVIGSLQDIDTQAYANGTQLYLSPTVAGAWTSVKQYAPAHLVYVGIVIRSHPTQGVVEIRIQNGFEMDELHNVFAQNPNNNAILQYKTSTSLWTSVDGTTTNIAEGTNLYYTDARARGAISLTTTGTSGAATYNNTTGVFNIPQYQSVITNPVTGTGVAGQVTFWNGTSSVTGDSGLIWDNTNKILTARTSTNGTNIIQIQSSGGTYTHSLGVTSVGYDLFISSARSANFNLGQVGDDFQITKAGVNAWRFGGNGGTGNAIIPSISTSNIYAGHLGYFGFYTAGSTLNMEVMGMINRTDNNNYGVGLFYKTAGTLTQGIGLRNNGNVLINTTTDAGFRLDVNGTGRFIGQLTANSFVPTSSTIPTNGMYLSGTNTLGFATNGTLDMVINEAGSVGIGTSSLTGYSLRVSKNITGATTAYGVMSDGVIQSDVTASVRMFNSNPSTLAASFTLTNLNHYIAQQGAIGAGSTITNQFGFLADSTLIGATNNYGFFGNIPNGTNRFNLYMGGSANNFLAGSLGIGSLSLTAYNLRVSKTITGGTSSFAIVQEGSVQSDVTSSSQSYTSILNTQASSFTLSNYSHYLAQQGTIGAGSSITTQNGFYVISNLTGATFNYGFRGGIPSGTNRWNLYMEGTADNYMAGSLGIGATSLTGFNLLIQKDITGATSSFGIHQTCVVRSAVTSAAYVNSTNIQVENVAFTLPILVHYRAAQNTFGASATVTNQYGFSAESTLTGATNNYGFYGGIAAATNRWNLYMAGTANNYLEGNLWIGTTSSPDSTLRVRKTLTGLTTMYGIRSDGAFQSDVTSSATNFASFANTAAASFTLSGFTHYSAQQGTIGAGSSIANQYGFLVTSNLTSATNNFGFFGNIPSGTNRWNIYMQGTAQNYLAGALSIGVTTADASALLQIDSTTKGFLPPRMTAAQRAAIATPATGLIVYQTDGVEGLWLRTSTGWVELTVV